MLLSFPRLLCLFIVLLMIMQMEVSHADTRGGLHPCATGRAGVQYAWRVPHKCSSSCFLAGECGSYKQSHIKRSIQRLAPRLPRKRTEAYARAICTWSAFYHVDPLLVTALMWHESRFRSSAAKHGNYGLLQVRVSATAGPEWAGREQRLLDYRVGVRAGVRLMSMWRNYHLRVCGYRSGHHWISHYQWGRYVGDTGSGDRVLATRIRLQNCLKLPLDN